MDLALKMLPRQRIPEVLVGYDNSDDAGVYQLTPEVAIVQTVDYFAPIVDDAYTYGQISAANALSDIYAMGGQPKTALSIVAFPTKGPAFSILGDIMRGGMSKLEEAGVALLGGHSVRDDEIKFGYAVTGIVDPRNIKQNSGARVGNRLILTKPLGTGLITTALKRGKASPEHVDAAVQTMLQLNHRASVICLEHAVDAMTDVTGFGLLGHTLEVARASHISVSIDHRRLPILPGALEYSQAGLCAGGLVNNREFFGPSVQMGQNVPQEIQDLLYDPQTSGGLLVFCGAADCDKLISEMRASGLAAVEIGSTSEPQQDLLTVC